MPQPLQQDVEFLEHFGKKGMRWGVHQQTRLDASNRVAKGEAMPGDKGLVLGKQSALSLIRNKGLKGAAAKDAAKLQAMKDRVESGQASTKDMLSRYGGMQLFNLG